MLQVMPKVGDRNMLVEQSSTRTEGRSILCPALVVTDKTLAIDRSKKLVSEETNGLSQTRNVFKVVARDTPGDALKFKGVGSRTRR